MANRPQSRPSEFSSWLPHAASHSVWKDKGLGGNDWSRYTVKPLMLENIPKVGRKKQLTINSWLGISLDWWKNCQLKDRIIWLQYILGCFEKITPSSQKLEPTDSIHLHMTPLGIQVQTFWGRKMQDESHQAKWKYLKKEIGALPASRIQSCDQILLNMLKQIEMVLDTCKP